MRAGRLNFWVFLVFAAGLAVGGCEHLNPYRQGLHTTYNKELQDLGDKVSREEPAETPGREDHGTVAAETTKEGLVQASHRDAPSLLSAIHMRPPEPVDYGSE